MHIIKVELMRSPAGESIGVILIIGVSTVRLCVYIIVSALREGSAFRIGNGCCERAEGADGQNQDDKRRYGPGLACDLVTTIGDEKGCE